MAETRSKHRFPRRLFSPFAFCKPHKLISDIVHHNRRRREDTNLIIPHSSTSMEFLLPPPSPQPRPPYTSLCKPRCPDNLNQMVNQTCILSSLHYQKLSPSTKCPPSSPASPIKQKHKTEARYWFSSDHEREGDDITESEIESPGTLFSSSTSSSRSRPKRTRRRPPSARRREARRKREDKGTFAVVRSSTDPCADFRASMAEMIIENSIFDVSELEDLLRCFLSLNSRHHHKVGTTGGVRDQFHAIIARQPAFSIKH